MSLLAIDIGGSGSRARLRGEHPSEVTGSALAVASGRPDHARVLGELAGDLAAASAPRIVAIGAAGLLSLGDPAELAAEAGRLWPESRVAIVPDVVAGLIGAWGLEGGVIVAAGTGAIGYAHDGADRWLRSDGWGHLLGDSGSGAWIGARGLDAALRRHDGRAGGSDTLRLAAQDRLGDLARLPSAVRSSTNEATFLASFAPAVAEAAAAGDDIAIRILDEAGWRLAETAVSLLVEGIPSRVALIGGVVAAGPALTGAFERGVAAIAPAAQIVIGGGEVLDGVERLAELVLDERIDRSAASSIALFPPRAPGA